MAIGGRECSCINSWLLGDVIIRDSSRIREENAISRGNENGLVLFRNTYTNVFNEGCVCIWNDGTSRFGSYSDPIGVVLCLLWKR